MQIDALRVKGLFGRLHHEIHFPTEPSPEGASPSLVILHGPNGVGKTTLLRMLSGMMNLDFNPMREIPVESAELDFTTGESLTAEWTTISKRRCIRVRYRDLEAVLHPDQPGPYRESDAEAVTEFRETFLTGTRTIQFDFIDIERLSRLHPERSPADIDPSMFVTAAGRIRKTPVNPKARRDEPDFLASRVQAFIRDAQVDYRFFFESREPSLVTKLIEGLEDDREAVPQLADVRRGLKSLNQANQRLVTYGLGPDMSEQDRLTTFVNRVARWKGERRERALTVIGAYIEVLESRSQERELVAERLSTFEHLMHGFFKNKSVTVDSTRGLVINDMTGEPLGERQLSSGEFHLLYLMVSALVTQRRGTVVAIDEPEMSMHIAWQRKLVPALVECASRAQPLFILATHSPEIAASYPEALVELSLEV